MQSPEASTAVSPTQYLALANFADEVVGTLARLFAYVGTLVLFAILALAGLGQLPDLRDDQPTEKPGWAEASRSHPAFALSRLDSSEKTASYTILRHPEGGRRDVMRWAGDADRPADRPLAELEIYLEGNEFDVTQPATSGLAVQMRLAATTSLEQAGLIDTKFGPVALFKPTGTADGAPSCLGYLKRNEEPALQISGFTCQDDTMPARRAAVACTLNRLTLLTSGNEPKLAELFAHAELKRRSCAGTGSADWLLGAANAQLRGAL
ncbi:hypothetical protein [Bradyrhizobium sp. Gha]|uniref:hypothetical protein n=1 Tax=Bradyrhizobium sp. Gha TaxID=1855318 RepID=UPI0008F24171|nr:hypothetical protein [Bradyrhizobium sp. Gha]SFJ39830.1 hypothetical protein SAMN05216525_12425 [Bradyrhizobium sp. Gha]